MTQPYPSTIELLWGGAARHFALPVLHRIALERAVGAHFAAMAPGGEVHGGAASILRRLITDAHTTVDVRETIYQGLMGGGETPNDASRLVAQFFDARPEEESRGTAVAILTHALFMPEDVGKKAPAARKGENRKRATRVTPASTPPKSSARRRSSA